DGDGRVFPVVGVGAIVRVVDDERLGAAGDGDEGGVGGRGRLRRREAEDFDARFAGLGDPDFVRGGDVADVVGGAGERGAGDDALGGGIDDGEREGGAVGGEEEVGTVVVDGGDGLAVAGVVARQAGEAGDGGDGAGGGIDEVEGAGAAGGDEEAGERGGGEAEIVEADAGRAVG